MEEEHSSAGGAPCHLRHGVLLSCTAFCLAAWPPSSAIARAPYPRPVHPLIHPPSHPPAASFPQDKTNTLFSGTVVTAGRVRGVVVGTGAATAIGKIRCVWCAWLCVRLVCCDVVCEEESSTFRRLSWPFLTFF